ncbi:MAG: 5-formyltetrahydrofolate cyclo-ligase [Isosphaeraceae bacterium]|nr:5-formyltetrahydrofolate cyclo-ligase [Isosphaeraceae bacterium]
MPVSAPVLPVVGTGSFIKASAASFMDIRAQKRALRRTAVERIHSLDPVDRQSQQGALVDRFIGLPGYRAAETVLLYATAFPEEIDTAPMLEQALADRKRLLCPRVARRQLQLYVVQDLRADLVAGTLGIPEPRPGAPSVGPDQVDWVLVPGLLFDEQCYRLGRGAGHYDRLLPQLRRGVSCWALAFDCQWVDALPIEPHDVPLDGIVSPGKSLCCRIQGRVDARGR